ncbi:hypothetical protein PENTCL1PPCAC_27539, partial [Pristionchus entomophagus]
LHYIYILYVQSLGYGRGSTVVGRVGLGLASTVSHGSEGYGRGGEGGLEGGSGSSLSRFDGHFNSFVGNVRSHHEEGQRLDVEVGDDVAEHVEVSRLRVTLDELEERLKRQSGDAGVEQREEQIRGREGASEKSNNESQSKGASHRCSEKRRTGRSKGRGTIGEHQRHGQRSKEGQRLGIEVGGVEASSEENSTSERVREQEHAQLNVRSSNGLLSLDRVVGVEWKGHQCRHRDEESSEEEMDEATEHVGSHEEANRRAQGQHRSPEEGGKHRGGRRLDVALVLDDILNRRLERLRLRCTRGQLLLQEL